MKYFWWNSCSLRFVGCNWERMLHGDDLAWTGRRVTSILTWLNACYFAISCFIALLLCLTLITHCWALLRPVTVQAKDPFTSAISWTTAIVSTIAILFYWVNRNRNHNCKNGNRTHFWIIPTLQCKKVATVHTMTFAIVQIIADLNAPIRAYSQQRVCTESLFTVR